MPASAEPAPQPDAAQPKAAQPVMMASVPMPKAGAAAEGRRGAAEQPKSIAGLLGNLFGGSQAQAAQPAPPAPTPDRRLARQQYAPGGEAEAYRRRCTPPPMPAAQRYQPSHATLRRPSRNDSRQASAPAPQTPAPEMRTAYSATPSGDGVLLRAHSRWCRPARSRAAGPRCAKPARRGMDCFVYVLGTRSKTRHLTYVGWTNDVARRLAQA